MSATEYDALMSVVEPLIKEGYQIVISKSETELPGYEGVVYRVTVMDGEIIITQAESGILCEALSDVFQSTPER